jgi:hypothetical protein
MGDRGDPSRCFCQYFRLRGKQWSDASSAAHREALRAQVEADPAPGVLATDDSGTPVGWCARVGVPTDMRCGGRTSSPPTG